MAGSLLGGRGKGRYRPMAEINVTPLVDVMLVLLIIFMVAAPLMTVGVPVDLPKTQASQINQDNEPITVSVNTEGKVFLQESEVPLEGLVAQLRQIGSAQPPGAPERRIFVRGDRAIAYGRIMEVMGTISSGGFSRVALIAEQPAGRAPTPPPAPGAGRPNAAPNSAPNSGPNSGPAGRPQAAAPRG